MLPSFPNFKKLELTDKSLVERITHRYPPYSDFNFISMWSWDIHEKMMICELNDNLVVRFTDYITSKSFYSFLGSKKVNETAKALLSFSKKESLEEKLKLVPEISAKELNKGVFLVSEDRDNHDYVIPTQIFKHYDTKETKSKGKSVKKFLQKFSPVVKDLDIYNPHVKNHILKLFNKWSQNKHIDPLAVKNELAAILRLFEGNFTDDLICTGVFLDSELVSFCISEPLQKGYSSIHFCKSDVSISPGTYAHILQQNANILDDRNRKLINIEQDLGIENMRKWKMSHGNHPFLKKYTVEYNKAWVI